MMPWPNNNDQFTAVEPEVVREMEEAHLPDGQTPILCKQHGTHYIGLDQVDILGAAILAKGEELHEDMCPMTLMEKEA